MAMHGSWLGGASRRRSCARILRGGAAGLALIVLAGCSEQVRHHGYAPDDSALAEIEVGRATQEDVAEAVGRPGTTGLMRGSGWYYVASERRQYAYRAPQEVDRQVVAISFDEGGVVSNIERFGLEDGEVVTLSRRVTDTGITGTTLLSQLLRNIGRFTAGDFF